MTSDEVRRVFDTVLTAPPPDTADIDVTIRTGRRRRRRRTVLLSSAAALAVLAITATAILPGNQRRPTSPAADPAATSAAVTRDEGTTVTVADQLLGSWSTIELDGQNVRAIRDGGNRPLGVKFEQDGTTLRWGASDVVNYHSGTFSVSKDGRFQANPGTMTYLGTTEKVQLYPRNPEAVEQATEAHVVAPTPTEPPKLLLLTGGKITAVYTPAAQ